LTAPSVLELAARDGVQVRLAASGNLKASGPSEALARWLPELRAMKPAILSMIHNDQRRCFVCGQPASFGFGVRLLEGREGRWTCAAHRPHGEGRA
jgi:hypothetical protein